MWRHWCKYQTWPCSAEWWNTAVFSTVFIFLTVFFLQVFAVFRYILFFVFRISEHFYFSVQQFSLLNVICSIYLSLPNIYFQTIVSLTMFLKVLNKNKPKLLLIIDVLLFTEFLELVAINSKWILWFGRFLQYMPGLEVLACSFNTDINYVITMLQLRPWITKSSCSNI